MLPELSIVIVNYNGQKYLKNCLDSIYGKITDVVFETIIVDNNSSDDSLVFLANQYPQVVVIPSKENLGFGKANNLGVKKALGKNILLLNYDTILLDDIAPAIKFLEQNLTVGAITINMLGSDKQYIPAVGKFPTMFNLVKLSFLNEPRKAFITGKFSKELYTVDWVTGAFMLLRKKDYEQAGGFDPDYFMYVEDVDLCRRIANLGKSMVFMPNLSYIHFVGFNKTREPLLIRGYQIYVSKHFSGIKKTVAQTMIQINKMVKSIKK